MAQVDINGAPLNAPTWLPDGSRRSVHRWCHNGRNILRYAVISALNIRSSSAIERTRVSRTGNGIITLTGPYTGDEDTDVEVQITSGAGTPRVSAPVFTGVGTGEMTDLAALPGATAQQYTLTLIDLGVDTAEARTEIEGYTLRSKVTGAVGNSIRLAVDVAGLVAESTNFSLLFDLPKGTEEITGASWDWDTAVGQDDAVPVDARRLSIGNDATVYRQWKVYRDGQWRYRFLPGLQREYRAGDKVRFITGSRTCTLTDGLAPEVYAGIITLRDLLVAIDAGSALVSVDAVPGTERTPDNLAALLDLRTRTDARIDFTTGQGTEHARGFINAFAAGNASTELITARCYAHEIDAGAGIGREKWALSGSVSGALGTLITAQPYVHPLGKFGLSIPTRTPDGWGEARGDISHSVSYSSAARDLEPPICLDTTRLGSNAQDKSITFVYRTRPSGDCSCEAQTIYRHPNTEECLGIDILEEDTLNNLAPGYAARLMDVAAWHSGAIAANASINAEGEADTARYDIALANQARAQLLQTLASMYGLGVVDLDGWTATTTYAQGKTISPGNDYRYQASTGGDSAGSPPAWPTTLGATVADGTVTWTCLGKTPEALFDEKLTAIDADFLPLEGLGTKWAEYASKPLYQTANAYSVGDMVISTSYQADHSPTTRPATNPSVWVCIRAGTSGTPQGSSSTGTLPSGSSPAGTIVAGAYVNFTGSTKGTEVWLSLGNNPDFADENMDADNVSQYLNKYRAWLDEVLSAAEVVPNFNSASTAGNAATIGGGACWQDQPEESHWWVPEGQYTQYLPAFTNREYISVTRGTEETGPMPTHEFSFTIKVKCVGDLREGDSVTISIGDAAFPPTYQVGDRLIMATVAARDLYLSGGQDGDDTLTWSVLRSVDGPGSAYAMNKAAPALYDDGDAQFRLNAGGIPFGIGDVWSFCIESGTWKWRRDAGAWSADVAIGATALGDGLGLDFQDGACPSAVAGDEADFTAYQPYAVVSSMTPDDQSLAWSGDTTTITLTATGLLDSLLLGLHTLPNTALVRVTGMGLDRYLPWRRGVMALVLDAPLQDPVLTITITQAPDASIGWLWGGLTIETDVDADTQARTRQYLVSRGGGVNPTAHLLGRGTGARLEWQGLLSDQSMRDFLDMLEYIKTEGGQPVCFIPQDSAPEDAMLVRMSDILEMEDILHYLPDDPLARLHRLQLDLSPYYA